MSLKAANQTESQLLHAFPGIKMGQWNCRKISDGSAYSQHAWGAGLDITHGDFGYSTDPEHQLWLDGVAAWLTEHQAALSIRKVLWRVKDHYNHIHVDHWAYNIKTPPCDGGVTEQKASDGTILQPFLDHGPENGYVDGWLPPPTEGELEMLAYTDWANGMFDHFSDQEIANLYDAGFILGQERDDAIAYWVRLRDLGTERTPGQRHEVARFIQTSTVSAWLNTAGVKVYQ